MARSHPTSRRSGAPAAGEVGPRPAIWAALRNGEVLTVSAAAALGRCDTSSARTFLRGLMAGGIIDEVSGDPLAVRIAAGRDPGPSVPRLRQDGSSVAQGRDRATIWRAARVLKQFDVASLVAATGVPADSAKVYLQYLVKAGYVQATFDPTTRAPTIYRVIPSRYTGPLAPQIARIRTVWDPNIGAVVLPTDPAEGGEE